MEAASYEPKERTHSKSPTFCWLWVTSGNNRTPAEAQQNTSEWWWKAGSVPEMSGCCCGVGGMNMCPWLARKQEQHKVQGQSPHPPRINLAIHYCQLKLSIAKEKPKRPAYLKCCALICYCIWGCFGFQGKKENLWQLHSTCQASQVCQGHHARHYGCTTLAVVSQ